MHAFDLLKEIVNTIHNEKVFLVAIDKQQSVEAFGLCSPMLTDYKLAEQRPFGIF